MRLIDADALVEFLGTPEDWRDEAINKIINNTPSADAVPVVRGEWILVGTNGHDYETSVEEECSLCGRYVYRYDTQPQDNFCPNCGARMGGEE